MRMKNLKPNSYWLTRICFLHAISFIYFVAFIVAYKQNKVLIGDEGLLPVQQHMEILETHTDSSIYKRLKIAPTLLWFAEPWTNVNGWLDNIALAGATLSGIVLLTGSANFFIMLTLWVLYQSLVNVGQRWYSFGWESQLLETGFIAMFSVPLLSLSRFPKHSPPPWIMVWGLRWLVVRIILGAGLIKLRGDECWSDLTCMNYHYETQPVPNPLSYYLHQSPEILHKGETLGNHIVELIVPFFTFLTRGFRNACGIIQIMFQVILILSGNLSFLNWLTIVPSIGYFDDKFLSRFFTKTSVDKVKNLQSKNAAASKEGYLRKAASFVFALLIGTLSFPVVVNLASKNQIMNVSFDPLRIVNTYGAFGSITKVRHEVILEGTHSMDPNSIKAKWLEYEFHCKPGATDKRPCVISPYHYRLDWLMWFAAFQNYEENPWLIHLTAKFLLNDPEASTLIARNPFLGKPAPRFIRAQLYKYQFTKPGSPDALAGHWYNRTLVGMYIPPADKKMLKPLFNKLGWKTLQKS